MKRVKISPRGNYQNILNETGFLFSEKYWLEDSYYEFSKLEIATIEFATAECYKLYEKAVDYVIKHNLWKKLGIPSYIVPRLIESWEADDLSIYGRFDFILVNGEPKLLEFNADTPTSLLEASIIQWNWKMDQFPRADQFNSIHESLIESWKFIKDKLSINEQIHFACTQESLEDESTTLYLASTANEAGIDTAVFDISELSYNHDENKFMTPDENTYVNYLFKLYPYEWMFNEKFGKYLSREVVTLFEPLWKSIMSNKYLLNIISELSPSSPYILKCGEHMRLSGTYCKKPIYSREGANVNLVKDNKIIESTQGEYGEEGFVYQELVEAQSYDGKYPVLGSWIIGGQPCGMGIRETDSLITDDKANFVPHIIK